jgi:uncharacterized protein YjbI with pentapeptide repeats
MRDDTWQRSLDMANDPLQAHTQRQHLPWWIMGGLTIFLGSGLIFAAYRFGWPGTGFQGKTVWDWLQLLIIPLVLTLAAVFFNQANTRTERQFARERYQRDLEIAENRYKQDKETALDKQREDLLQIYLDRISELLLEKDLRTSVSDAEVRNVARVRTINLLIQLDARRVGYVFTFLSEAHLRGGPDPVIDLQQANFTKVYWSQANLGGTNLSGVNLQGANLSQADFESADLSGAILIEADLREARLLDVDLHGAKLGHANLSGADSGNLADLLLSNNRFHGANLSNANLFHADLSNTSFCRANFTNALLWDVNLSGARLQEANFTNADFSRANLSNADFSGADLSNANFSGADLSNANFSGANLSNAMGERGVYQASLLTAEQLADANLQGATMPDGTRHS